MSFRKQRGYNRVPGEREKRPSNYGAAAPVPGGFWATARQDRDGFRVWRRNEANRRRNLFLAEGRFAQSRGAGRGKETVQDLKEKEIRPGTLARTDGTAQVSCVRSGHPGASLLDKACADSQTGNGNGSAEENDKRRVSGGRAWADSRATEVSGTRPEDRMRR